MAQIVDEDLAEQRRYLMRYALLHLHDRSRAEGVPAVPPCVPG